MTDTRQDGTGFRKTIMSDIRGINLKQTAGQEYGDLKDFFLDEEKREKLARMNIVKRAFVIMFWLMRALIMKLTPFRRLLLVLALALLVLPQNIRYQTDQLEVTIETGIVTIGLILFVLMLELKDKLVAHDELREGRAVQSALMPANAPELAGWDIWLFSKTANEVGGDLVDVQSLGDNRLRLSLADVSGKGLKAALLAARLQATIRALTPVMPSLTALAGKMNSIFYSDNPRSAFASVICIDVEENSGTVTLVNAGHLPPILYSKGITTEMAKGDPAMGILPQAAYNTQTCQLQPGDSLLVYTDGLSEAKNMAGEFFGQERVQSMFFRYATLPSAEAGTRMVNSITEFRGPARVHDDLSIIVMRRPS